MSAEDDLYDTIRPRIDAAGGDTRRVIAFSTLTSAGVPVAIPDDVPILEGIIAQADAALLVIDPLVAFLSPRHNVNSDQAVRQAFHSLKGLAERTGAAIVAVRHLNKSMTGNPLYRGGGSIGIIGAARCGLLLAADPDDPERRILASTKDNLGRPPPSLAFRLEAPPGSHVARVVWDGESQWQGSRIAARICPRSGAALAPHRGPGVAARRARRRSPPALGKSCARPAKPASAATCSMPPESCEGVRIGKERVAGGRWIWSSTVECRRTSRSS